MAPVGSCHFFTINESVTQQNLSFNLYRKITMAMRIRMLDENRELFSQRYLHYLEVFRRAALSHKPAGFTLTMP